ncbi:MAG: DUF1501 domain-containing protein [Alphaproteobacteria bacterium]|nr:DUF1501 domain-containing protein [Alphaproteobacteria bacterium]
MNRRQLLGGAAAGAAGLFSAAGWAMPAGSPRLLILFLRGGYDSASLLVPQANDFYRRSRPGIAIAPDRQRPLADGWALNAVADPLLPLWNRRQLAFIPFAGSPDLSRSHFETQDIIEFGYPGRNRAATSGFMNRLAVEIGARGTAMAFTQKLPIAMRGSLVIPNSDLGQRSALSAGRQAAIAAMYAGDAQLGEQVSAGMGAGAAVSAALQREMATSGRDARGVAAFEANAQRIGLLMRDRIALGFADIGGWDTHVGQAGGLDYRLGVLARGLSNLAGAMGPAWRDTAVLVISEFGRTFRQNGSQGTDHGHGTAFLLLGGAVAGGRIAGRQQKVNEAMLHQNRDFPVLNDGRDVMGALFARLYGLGPAAVQRIFPASRPQELALL